MNEAIKCPWCQGHCDISEMQYEYGTERQEICPAPEREQDCSFVEVGRSTDRCLYWIVRELAHKIRYLIEPKGGQKRVLSIVYHEKEIPQNKLTEIIGVTPGTMSEILSKLEAAGYVRRISSEEDKRTFLVQITEAGSGYAKDNFERRDNCAAKLFSPLNEEEKETLMHLLIRLDGSWQKLLQADEAYHSHCSDKTNAERT